MVAPNIEGTYQLVRRELPDGTVQFPPAMKGMITLHEGIPEFQRRLERRPGQVLLGVLCGPLHADRPGVRRDFRVPDRG